MLVPPAHWREMLNALERTAQSDSLKQFAAPVPEGVLSDSQAEIDALFAGEDLRAILNAMRAEDTDVARQARTRMERNSPLAMVCAIEIIHRLRGGRATIRDALGLEYRFTHRAMEKADFLEGIRAAVIDKDRAPVWLHRLDEPPMLALTQMLMPLGQDALRFETEEIPT